MPRSRLSNLVTLAIAIAAANPLAAAEPPAGRIAMTPESIQWGPAPPSLPPGAQSAVLEGNPGQPGLFTMRLRVPANYAMAVRRHPEAERVTVLSGSVCVGFGEKRDGEGSSCFASGSFYVNAGVPHMVWTQEEATVQITGVGPWQVEYLNPNDDPRNDDGT